MSHKSKGSAAERRDSATDPFQSGGAECSHDRIHIVAPLARREKVLQEITRPVFTLMTGGPLWQACSYLSYDAVRALGGERNLAHMSDTVLETYEECAQEADF